MTTNGKIAYVRQFMQLVAKAESYKDAIPHASFVRGLLSAWGMADRSISLESYKDLTNDLEIMMEVKRNLPVVQNKELF